MLFKRLELLGFKSFADKTTIEFDAGVTAIVGPNGCGKSNISDAIRWILGEQSAKSLRGARMEDLIFNGTATKEPLGLAEASLTLSNESRLLPVDYEEVTITRRLYRSGESEYLLNKNLVRLRDIHELLMGTGIGIENYSLVEQGKMDRILNARPEDRREIFEEAAGITKYEFKKKEALHKLEQTEANLLRVSDIIQEVKRQISTLERQAKKAEAYKTEFEKLKSLELAVASREFLIFEDRRQAREQAAAALKEKELEFSATVQEVEKKVTEGKEKNSALDQALRATQDRGAATDQEIRKSQDRILLNRERIGELTERAGNLAAQIESAQHRNEESRSETERLGQEFELIRQEESEGLVFLNSAEQSFREFEAEIQRSTGEENTIKERVSILAAQRARYQAEFAKVRAQQAAQGFRLKKIKQEEESLLREIRESDPSFAGTLFGPAPFEGPSSAFSRLALRSQIFKQKILAIFRAMFEKNRSVPGAEEETEIDAEIKNFSEELSKIQTGLSDERSRRRHEERLRLLASETQEAATEQNALVEREKQVEAEESLSAEEEKAQNLLLAQASRKIQGLMADKEQLLVRLTETRSKQSHCTARREKIEKDKNWISDLRARELGQLVNYEREREESGVKRVELEKENERLESETACLSGGRDALLLEMESVRLQREQRLEELALAEKEAAEKRSFLNSVRDQAHVLELEGAKICFEIDRLKERVFNAYQMDLLVQAQRREIEDAAAACLSGKDLDLEKAKSEIHAQKEKLNRLGPVNLVAITEHDEMRQRHEFLIGQEKDLVQAKEDLRKAIVKINRTTREMFTEAFAQIQKNFGEYFKVLFGGGSAELVLLDEGDVLESGIEIVTRPPGKKLQNISLLSGGEKALTAVALLFSLFKFKPSPFCVLDEVDAPLDESNIDRFCSALKEFISGSQFILITHNKRTMNLADALYGITMAETGVSRVVSVRFSDKKVKDKQEVLV